MNDLDYRLCNTEKEIQNLKQDQLRLLERVSILELATHHFQDHVDTTGAEFTNYVKSQKPVYRYL